MSKNGNKEAKKPKKAPAPAVPAGGAGVPAAVPPTAARNKRK